MSTVLRDCEVRGHRVDVRIDGGDIVAMDARLEPTSTDTEVVDARGGALLPGLHDQHVHVLALAADRVSVDCSEGLGVLTQHRGATGWLRGVRAHESVDRHALDLLVPDRPVRVQHRSGGLWMLNSRAVTELADALEEGPDVERDRDGSPTGRLWRYDARLRAALQVGAPAGELDLVSIAAEMRGYGLTAVTDATPDLDDTTIELLRAFPLPTELLGDPDGVSPWKLLLRDHDLPTYVELRDAIAARRPRPVAVHCVTRESLLLTLAVLDEVGRHPEDRIEHGAVVPSPEALRGLTVVTQPAFVTTRGDQYLRDVDSDDVPHLYRYASLLEAGVDVIASSDAPYGPIDPWTVIRAAATRDLGARERVRPEVVLAGYTRGRRVAVGHPADLVLLHTDLPTALDALDAGAVRRTWVAGR
ncbi:MAG: amidohydrolase family protein [Aeromicrobium sp.]